MAVVVVRGDVDLIRFGHGGDLDGLQEAVPDHVDDGDIGGIGVQERAEGAPAGDGFQ
jgi:hypothetical protein